LRERAGKVDEEAHEKFEPLYDGLDLKQPMAQFHHFNFAARRAALVFIALFFRDHAWFQMQCFTSLSLGNALYLTFASPLEKETWEDILMNYMEVGNELCVLVQAYISMTILYAEDADQNYAINQTLTAVIRA